MNGTVKKRWMLGAWLVMTTMGCSSASESAETKTAVSAAKTEATASAASTASTTPITTEKVWVKQINTREFRDSVADYLTQNGQVNLVGKSKLPCVVDFYTTWCGPCRRVAPIMEELAQEYEGRIRIYKVNTEAQDSRELAQVFGIRSIPTVFYFGGTQVQATQGALSKEQFKEVIETVLLNNNAGKK